MGGTCGPDNIGWNSHENCWRKTKSFSFYGGNKKEVIMCGICGAVFMVERTSNEGAVAWWSLDFIGHCTSSHYEIVRTKDELDLAREAVQARQQQQMKSSAPVPSPEYDVEEKCERELSEEEAQKIEQAMFERILRSRPKVDKI